MASENLIPVKYTIQIKAALLVRTQPGDLELYIMREDYR